MTILITLFYILFSYFVVCPPSEFIAAGFTIKDIFHNYLGSENTNFIEYQTKRICLTILIQSALPLGYFKTLWLGGMSGIWLERATMLAAFITICTFCRIFLWYKYEPTHHPVIQGLLPYVTPGIDWRVIASDFNIEFHSLDKIIIPLTDTSKLIVTRNWFILVSQYNVKLVKLNDCTMVATSTDNYTLTARGEDEVQYINIETIPTRSDIKPFSFRILSSAMNELQPVMRAEIRVPDHLSVMPTLIDRFINVFKQTVQQNPVYIVDQELELCIGCMQNQADVKLNLRCRDNTQNGDEILCRPCNCRALWCCSCMARWWATRAGPSPAEWLEARSSCPVCRAPFCLLDVCPARVSS